MKKIIILLLIPLLLFMASCNSANRSYDSTLLENCIDFETDEDHDTRCILGDQKAVLNDYIKYHMDPFVYDDPVIEFEMEAKVVSWEYVYQVDVTFSEMPNTFSNEDINTFQTFFETMVDDFERMTDVNLKVIIYFIGIDRAFYHKFTYSEEAKKVLLRNYLDGDFMEYLEDEFTPLIPILSDTDYIVSSYTILNDEDEIYLRTYNDNQTFTCYIIENDSPYTYTQEELVSIMSGHFPEYEVTQ